MGGKPALAKAAWMPPGRQKRTKTPDFPTFIPNGGMDNIAIIGARSGLTRCSRWSAVNDGVPAGEPARLMAVPRNTLSAHLAAAIALDANLPSYQAVSGISGQRRSP
jgi:hypothetical protein